MLLRKLKYRSLIYIKNYLIKFSKKYLNYVSNIFKYIGVYNFKIIFAKLWNKYIYANNLSVYIIILIYYPL